MAIRNDRSSLEYIGRRWWRRRRKRTIATRAHYPIVGSALADGVYGGSKSWPILRWESALRSTLIRLERSCSVSVSLLSARASSLFLFPPASCRTFSLSSRVASRLTLPILRQSTNGTYRLDAHNQARKRRSCAIGSLALTYSHAARNRLDCDPKHSIQLLGFQ